MQCNASLWIISALVQLKKCRYFFTFRRCKFSTVFGFFCTCVARRQNNVSFDFNSQPIWQNPFGIFVIHFLFLYFGSNPMLFGVAWMCSLVLKYILIRAYCKHGLFSLYFHLINMPGGWNMLENSLLSSVFFIILSPYFTCTHTPHTRILMPI